LTWIKRQSGDRRDSNICHIQKERTAMAGPLTTWLVIADGVQARVVAKTGVNAPLVTVSTHADPEARLPSHLLGSDRPGHTQESATSARHAIEPKYDLHRERKRAFANTIADLVNRAGEEKKFDRLILIAPPRTLGDLRRRLGAASRTKLAGELAKDLTKVANGDLEAHMTELRRLI
jgi:protein required for attachment to host cells